MFTHFVPLHVTSRVSAPGDSLMSTIGHELEKTEASCAVSACNVMLSGSARDGFRAAVALELEGGRCISQSGASPDVGTAIAQAFVACRERASAE